MPRVLASPLDARGGDDLSAVSHSSPKACPSRSGDASEKPVVPGLRPRSAGPPGAVKGPPRAAVFRDGDARGSECNRNVMVGW